MQDLKSAPLTHFFPLFSLFSLDSIFLFCPLRGNVGLSAVCAYDMKAVEEVFSKGKYMQKATVEQSHTKWVRYNGITPTPRPGGVSRCHMSNQDEKQFNPRANLCLILIALYR